jgi:hypothetical protein
MSGITDARNDRQTPKSTSYTFVKQIEKKMKPRLGCDHLMSWELQSVVVQQEVGPWDANGCHSGVRPEAFEMRGQGQV